MHKDNKRASLKNLVPPVAGIICALLFSFFLMFHTFSYDAKKSELRIASKVWSDFGAHIPLVRSFSLGPNTARLFALQPVESPLFPNEPIRYHYGFFAIAGLLEKLGVRIDWALNMPSAVGFFLLLLFIFLFSFRLFTNYYLSSLSVLLFLFNGSLSFLSFFREHPLSPNTLGDIITNSRFPAFGPWDGGNVTAFWTLNLYTNQRHLGLSYAIVLILLYIFLRKPAPTIKQIALPVVLLGLLMFINFAALAIAGIFLLWLFLVKKDIRKPVVATGLLTLPVFLLLGNSSNPAWNIAWQPGYLVRDVHTPLAFLIFWWENLGLHTILFPLGILLSPKPIRRLLAPPLILLFIVPNLYRFSPDMINNHKFFNFFQIIGNMFTAYAVVYIVKRIIYGTPKFNPKGQSSPTPGVVRITAGYLTGMILISFLTLSGIIDFFPVRNDSKGSVPDVSADPDAAFFSAHTSPADVIANSTWFYHPASLAGRHVYSGYTYFTWSYGYDQSAREARLIDMYRAPDASALCDILQKTGVTFVELNQHPETYLEPNWNMWNSLVPEYENPDTKRSIYARDRICAPLPPAL